MIPASDRDLDKPRAQLGPQQIPRRDAGVSKGSVAVEIARILIEREYLVDLPVVHQLAGAEVELRHFRNGSSERAGFLCPRVHILQQAVAPVKHHISIRMRRFTQSATA